MNQITNLPLPARPAPPEAPSKSGPGTLKDADPGAFEESLEAVRGEQAPEPRRQEGAQRKELAPGSDEQASGPREKETAATEDTAGAQEQTAAEHAPPLPVPMNPASDASPLLDARPVQETARTVAVESTAAPGDTLALGAASLKRGIGAANANGESQQAADASPTAEPARPDGQEKTPAQRGEPSVSANRGEVQQRRGQEAASTIERIVSSLQSARDIVARPTEQRRRTVTEKPSATSDSPAVKPTAGPAQAVAESKAAAAATRVQPALEQSTADGPEAETATPVKVQVTSQLDPQAPAGGPNMSGPRAVDAAPGDKQAQAPLDPATLDRAFRQVQRALSASRGALRGRSRELTIRLDPPELGSIQVRMEMHAGRMRAVVSVERAEVGERLTADLPRLMTSLEAAGVRPTAVEVRTGFQQQGDPGAGGTFDHAAGGSGTRQENGGGSGPAPERSGAGTQNDGLQPGGAPSARNAGQGRVDVTV